ncbi:OmpW/AlkL family protein [Paraburkholderia fungorum]|uniref:OmpW/AlkL family protein n=1 Tax=Paraburkholderia fungorum TaxID=134537 RepID=UPI003857EA62
MKKPCFALALVLTTVQFAHAQSAGQWLLNAGWFHIAPQSSSQPLTVSALARTTTQAGSGATADSADTFGLTTSYFVTDHIAIETALGMPPKLQVNGTGTLASFGEIGNARVWSPSIIVQYHFGAPSARIKPYVGAGISYVWFNDIHLSNGFQTGQFLYSPSTGNRLEGPTSVSLSKSLAPVVNAGLTFNIDSHWSVGVSTSYIWLSTRATLTTHSALGTVTSQAKVKVNPIVSFVSIGYRF